MASNTFRMLKSQNITNLLQYSSRRCSSSFFLKRKVKLPLQPKAISPLVVGPFFRDQKYKEPRPVGDFIFEEVEVKPEIDPKLKLILLKTVDELGVAGEVVEVDRDYGRHQLLSSQSAVYYNDFNLKKYKTLIDSGSKDRHGPSSAFVNATIKKLSEEVIIVVMNNVNPWTIDRRHIRVAFRASGYSVDESCIELPATPISGPNIEQYQGKDFAVTLTINNKEKVHVRCLLHHVGQQLRLDWDTEPRYILLDEQKELLESMFVKKAKTDEDFF